MKKIIVLAFALVTLTGCATWDVFTPRNNPLSNTQVANIEAAYGITLTAAVTYRRLCADKVIVRAKCAPIVTRLQNADRKVLVALRNLRVFVRDNPKVDPIRFVFALGNAVTEFQAVAQQNGVK